MRGPVWILDDKRQGDIRDDGHVGDVLGDKFVKHFLMGRTKNLLGPTTAEVVFDNLPLRTFFITVPAPSQHCPAYKISVVAVNTLSRIHRDLPCPSFLAVIHPIS